ncbi:hypothetical protein K0M31_009796 [Melipona bicolor]|uniref:Uncharacterized protein n=1 Tax=Melipona bicolor TaxID=60889 RepID=A0AA40FN53_9HYME|nr:hypothetical protein K0M31_009796 [Melipona bicolor]
MLNKKRQEKTTTNDTVHFPRKRGILIYVWRDGPKTEFTRQTPAFETPVLVEQYSGTWILIAARKSKKEAASRQRRTKDPEQLPQGRIKIPGPRIKEPAFQTAVKA